MQNFNYHSHTYRCKHADLDFKDEEYIKDYIKIGLKKIAFTDHCPEKNEIDNRQNMRMSYEARKEYLSSIKALAEKYTDKIEIKVGYEVEYLPGEEENIKELKEETDKIILGQHFIYDDNKNLKILGEHKIFSNEELIRYGRYLEKAMELGIPNIIAHPDIYMLDRESFGEIETEVAHIICRAAEKYNIPLEINLNKIFLRLFYLRDTGTIRYLSSDEQEKRFDRIKYPCKQFWEIASQYNLKVLYGLDAHHRGQILLWEELIELAHKILGEELIQKLNFIEE